MLALQVAPDFLTIAIVVGLAMTIQDRSVNSHILSIQTLFRGVPMASPTLVPRFGGLITSM